MGARGGGSKPLVQEIEVPTFHGREIFHAHATSLDHEIFHGHEIGVSGSARFEDQLRSFLEASGWRAEAPPDSGIELIAEKGARRYALEVKTAREPRRALLEGCLASAILRARAGASTMKAKPLAVVCAPFISDALLRELEEFVRRFGEGASWGAMDDSGLVVLHAPGMEGHGRWCVE